nr:MAG TPA: hypothetical protein [Caudoviricetes sp.]
MCSVFISCLSVAPYEVFLSYLARFTSHYYSVLILVQVYHNI